MKSVFVPVITAVFVFVSVFVTVFASVNANLLGARCCVEAGSYVVLRHEMYPRGVNAASTFGSHMLPNRF